MAAMPSEQDIHPADRYTPVKVERILKQFPFMLDRQSHDEHRTPSAKRISANDWLEKRMVERADVEWAVMQLPQPWYQVVYLVCVGGKSWHEVAQIIGKSERTVAYRKTEGLRMAAWLLGWRDSSSGYGPENAEKVRRRLFGK